MKNSVLVTGASGFIGSYIVDHFLKKDLVVVAMTRSGTYPIKHPNLKVVRGDMRDVVSLTNATKGISWVVHLAAAKQDEKDSYEINVLGAKNLVNACKKNGVNFIINVSTISTKIKIKGVYAETKNTADIIFMESGIPTTTLKLSIVYGDLKNAIFGSIAKFSKLPFTPIFGNGKCKFRPIYVKDVAVAIDVASTDESLRNKIYDIVGPDIISFDSLIKLIGEKIYDRKVRIFHLPEKFGFIIASIMSYVFYRAPITRSNILGSTQDVDMDYEAFLKNFKFKPISLLDGLNILKNQSLMFDEAQLVLSYLVSRSTPKIQITDRERNLYYMAISNTKISGQIDSVVYRYPFILGLLDFISLFHKDGALWKKLSIASAIIECSPSSAEWLIPKKRSVFGVLVLASYLSIYFVIKAISALFLFLYPNFVKRNVV